MKITLFQDVCAIQANSHVMEEDARGYGLDVDSLVRRSLHSAAAALRDPDQLIERKTERVHSLLELLEREPEAAKGT